MEVLESINKEELIQKLEKAFKEGFITNSDSYFVFAHDRIQEAFYSTLDHVEKEKLHYIAL